MFEVGAVKGWAILPWWVLAGFAMLGAIPVWWLVEMEGFGRSGETSDVEEDEVEEPEVDLPHRQGLGESSEPVAVGSPETVPEDLEEETDEFAREDEGLLSSTRLRRVSSPIGLRASPRPGGNRLSNGLGHSRSGFGAGGTSYH